VIRELQRRLAKVEAKLAIDPISHLSDQQLADRIAELEATIEAELGSDWRQIVQEQERAAGRPALFAPAT